MTKLNELQKSHILKLWLYNIEHLARNPARNVFDFCNALEKKKYGLIQLGANFNTKATLALAQDLITEINYIKRDAIRQYEVYEQDVSGLISDDELDDKSYFIIPSQKNKD